MRAGALLGRLLRANRKFASAAHMYRHTGLANSEGELNRLIAANAMFTLRYYGRFSSLASCRSRRRLQASIDVQGSPQLDAALAGGRGAILWAAHLGDFDLAASWLAQVKGVSPVVPIAAVPEVWRQTVYATLRQRCGLIELPHQQVSWIELADHLAQERLVVLMMDRRPARHSIPVQMLGVRASVSRAALDLAVEAGAPLLSAATFTDSGHRILCFGTHWSARQCDMAPAAVAQAVANELSWAIRQAPQQWHLPADGYQLPMIATEAQAVESVAQHRLRRPA